MLTDIPYGILFRMTTTAIPTPTPLRKRGEITLPQAVREQLNLQPGDSLLVSIEDGRVILTPTAFIPRDQTWFWSPEWQAGEAIANAEAAAGLVTTHHSDEDFLKSLATD